jgi:hypothetical protein
MSKDGIALLYLFYNKKTGYLISIFIIPCSTFDILINQMLIFCNNEYYRTNSPPILIPHNLHISSSHGQLPSTS